MHDITKSERKALREALNERVQFAEQLGGEVIVLLDGVQRGVIRRGDDHQYQLDIELVSLNWAHKPNTLEACKEIARYVFEHLLRAQTVEEEEV
jgi:hypothetical protein